MRFAGSSAVAVALLLVACVGLQAKEPDYYDLLSTDAVGAQQFIKKHPEWDGRGTVIAVLDTGVDMSVSGLTVTSTGQVKVVEARDFSGQGVVHLRKPEKTSEREEPVLKTGGGVIRGAGELTPKPGDSLYLGFLDESKFRNSSVGDINNNGKWDDKFAILMAKVKVDGKEVIGLWVDTDADGNLSDEQMQRNYSETKQYFFMHGAGQKKTDPTMAFAAEASWKRREVSLHFADGAHGTHVAGIASGYSLFGKKGFNGIAPGAQVMSLKIGNNTLSGGSTTTESMKNAIEFAGKWSKEHNTPVVLNVSYGIGTEIEGDSDIDRITDRLVAKYPLMSVATSAGNSGPGISSVGTPAGADLAFSTAALLTRANASSLYGAKIGRDVLFYFSSRGGELAKPDGVAPGCAVSQVPPWDSWPIMRGTSMASPQVAGCLSLLASGAVQDKGKMKFNGGMLVRALRNSGRPLPGYNVLDQGTGVVWVPAGYASLKKLASRQSAARIAGFRVDADCPTCMGGKTRAAFFRAGTYIPAKPAHVEFSISPIFMNHVPREEQQEYAEAFDLSVDDADWVELTSDAVLFRKGANVSLDVHYDPSKLKEPGIHTAVIRGTSRELNKKQQSTMFELWNVVVVPYVFDLTNGFVRKFRKSKLPPGEIKRYFVRVPEGAASMRVTLAPVEGRYAQSRLVLFDPQGREYDFSQIYADSEKSTTATVLVSKDRLDPGIWEAVVMTHYVAKKTSYYNLDIAFSGFHYEGPDEFFYEMGDSPRATFTVRTTFDQVFTGRVHGGLQGYMRTKEYSSKTDRMTIPLTMEKGIARATFKMSMDEKTYARFTDAAVSVVSGSGRAIVKSGFTSKFLTVEVTNPDPDTETNYTMKIDGGFAERTGKEWKVQVEEYYEKARQVPAKVWCDGYSYFTLYPNFEQICEVEFEDKPQIAPEGFVHYGELRFKDDGTKRDAMVLPMKLRVGK